MSRTPETSHPLSNVRTGDGRFAPGNAGWPGWPRGAVRGAASALDRGAADASTELVEVATDLPRAGTLAALKRAMARLRPLRRGIRKRDRERLLRALEEALLEIPEKSPEVQTGRQSRALFPSASRGIASGLTGAAFQARARER